MLLHQLRSACAVEEVTIIAMGVVPLELLVLLVSSLVFGYLWWRLSRGPGAHVPRGARLPPLEGGWLPWIGCALEFGKAPLWHIKKAHKKVINIA